MLYYTDKIQPSWWQSATFAGLQGYAWCKIAGVTVAGSETVPVAQIPPQTGDTPTDLASWIEDVIQAMTGDAPEAFGYPTALFTVGWGVAVVGENTQDGRPCVAFGATADYDFGALNLPASTGDADARIWYFRVEGVDTLASEIVPSVPIITAYEMAHGGAHPILQVLELNPE